MKNTIIIVVAIFVCTFLNIIFTKYHIEKHSVHPEYSNSSYIKKISGDWISDNPWNAK